MQELGGAPFSFSMMISITWVGVFLAIGLLIRMRVKFVQKYAIPSCLIGGLLGCICFNLGLFDNLGRFRPNPEDLQLFVFHIFNFTFVCFGLTGLGAGGSKEKSSSGKQVVKSATAMAFANAALGKVTIMGGMLIIVAYNLIMGTNLLESAASLMSSGFVAGPPTAMATGVVWQQAGFPGMANLGLTYGAMGYIFSILVGVPVANMIMKRRGLDTTKIVQGKDELQGVYEADKRPSAGTLRLMESNMDSMSFQVMLIFITYLIAYAGVSILQLFLPPNIMGIFWSMFAFLFCLPAGLIVRTVFLRRVFKADHLFDAGCQARILGVIVDLLGLASLLAIQIAVLREWWGVLIITSTWCGLATAIFLRLWTKNQTAWADERWLAFLGTATGTVTSGLVLLRMIDPDFKSPVPIELGIMALPNLLITVPLMPITLPYSYAQVFWHEPWTVVFGLNAVLFLVYGIGMMLPIWGLHTWRKNKVQKSL